LNRWILHHAAAAADRVTVLVLWDGKPAHGPGGVSHMVELGRRRGANVVVIHMGELVEASGRR
jgi:hypothetical protein